METIALQVPFSCDCPQGAALSRSRRCGSKGYKGWVRYTGLSRCSVKMAERLPTALLAADRMSNISRGDYSKGMALKVAELTVREWND